MSDFTGETIETGLDVNKLLIRGLAASLRNYDYFTFYQDLFKVLDEYVTKYEKNSASAAIPHFFLERNSSHLVVQLVELVTFYYQQNGGRPIVPSRDEIKAIAAAVDPKLVDSDDIYKIAEHEIFQTFLLKAYGGKVPEIFQDFAESFRRRGKALAEQDFLASKEMLSSVAKQIANLFRTDEIDNNVVKNSAHDKRAERVKTVELIFEQSASDVFSFDSLFVKSMLLQPETFNFVPFRSAAHVESIDSVMGGFSGAGLTVFLGGSGHGKTTLMASIVANHVRYDTDNFSKDPGVKSESPHIWIISTEGDKIEYVNRVLQNLMQVEGKDLAYWFKNQHVNDDFISEQVSTAFAWMEGSLKNVKQFPLPRGPSGVPDRSVEKILARFDAYLAAGNHKPSFIILDYILHLTTAVNKNASQAEVMKNVAATLEVWSSEHRIPIVTAVQLNREGNKNYQNLEFYDVTSIAEASAILNSSSLFIAFMPLHWKTPNGTNKLNQIEYKENTQMALKVIKNRKGLNNQFFISELDYAKNSVMHNVTRLKEHEWEQKRNDILATRMQMRQTRWPGGKGGRGGFGGANAGAAPTTGNAPLPTAGSSSGTPTIWDAKPAVIEPATTKKV